MSCNCLLNAIVKTTDCECAKAGFCSRHNCTKTEHFHGLCRNDPRYFNLWESGKGPCIGTARNTGPRPVRLGDVIARVLGWLRIHPWPGCGCEGRKAWLNRFVVWGWWRAA